MKKIILLLLVTSLLFSCSNDNNKKKTSSEEKEQLDSESTTDESEDEEGWTDDQKQMVMDDCREGEFSKKATSKKDCNCILKHLSNNFTYQEYRLFSGKAKEDEEGLPEPSPKNIKKLEKRVQKLGTKIQRECEIELE